MPWVILVIATVCSATSECAAEPSARLASDAEADYRLVWADEFDVDGPPNPANWDFEHGFVRNEELQWYQPDNARCEGGRLVIEARRERVGNPNFDPAAADWRRRRPHADYTSGSITTRGRHRWQYGRFVMRGRIDGRAGLWPAFWTLGEARRWPACGEIDIMEYYDGKLLANAAWLGRRGRPKWDSSAHPISHWNESDWIDRFHVWRMDWDRDRIQLFVDEKLLNEIDVETAFNDARPKANPFREPHYIVLNLAVGGTQGGDPSGTEFPARLEVDYVRVFQRPRETREHQR